MKSLNDYMREIEALRFQLRKVYGDLNAWVERDASMVQREIKLTSRIERLAGEVKKIYGIKV